MIEPLGINNFIASFRMISRIVFDIQVERTHKCRKNHLLNYNIKVINIQNHMLNLR